MRSFVALWILCFPVLLITLFSPLLANISTTSHDSSTVHPQVFPQPPNEAWPTVGSSIPEEEPSDYEVWSAIVSSMAKWEEMKKRKAHKHHVRKRSEEVVCYRGFGCFRDEGAFDYLDTLPASPEAIGTKFILYTNKSRNTGELLWYDNSSSLYYSHFNSSNPVKVIIHGFGSSGRKMWVLQMTEALLAMEDVNVIVVDWEKGSALPNYVQAAANTQLVGKQLAALIRMINYERGLSNSDYHLIGFSLGAHVAGFTGMECHNISRITGLDPASPLFEGYDPKIKLDPSDATFVDVIHSNGNSFLKGGLGTFEPLGHADFYPNGGRVQIGCNNVFIGAVTDIIYGKWQSLCNHRRAFRFFIDSIIPSCRFPAFPCDSYENFLAGKCFKCSGQGCVNMGYYADRSQHARGKYYLVTRETEPFCANQYRISIASTRGQGTTWGKLEISFIGEDNSNETFVLTNESQEINDKQDIQGLIVADPSVRNVTAVIVKYTKYRGWIYTGLDRWDIDKIQIHNSNGHVMSFCGHAMPILNGEPKFLPLIHGDCTAEPTTQRLARLIWQVVGEPVAGRDPRPPKLLWKIMVDDTSKYHWHNS
ncbi:pancreatic triacylglycerol lipase-like isoform X1 [Argiope bruennichi]|uniref:pancreatic triacylglycerol lipase-like isoform X1 n=2 Tax=Argiope bruennichi TaxID=94029 RepID=UPI00249427A7|nr:pancreatic triacylglycerol lipase-like isoform X1 [Argiope bruennichi]